MEVPGERTEEHPEKDTPEYALWVVAHSGVEAVVTPDKKIQDLRGNDLDLRGVEDMEQKAE